jgi:Rrf2 family protein
MKFSTKTRYGLRAIIEIAINEKAKGILQKDIAKNQEISYKYLDHIINSLKVAGLITRAAGRKSGYVLTLAPEKISVYDVHKAFEPGICIVDCLAGNTPCERQNHCALNEFWEKLNNLIIEYFKSTTIRDLTDKQLKLDNLRGTPHSFGDSEKLTVEIKRNSLNSFNL